MEELNLIKLDKKEIDGLPLFYRKIYFNIMSNWQEENKLIRYSKNLQADVMRALEPTRDISKTVNKKLIIERK
jgi:hypothetical protein